jgi:hypothetical protein
MKFYGPETRGPGRPKGSVNKRTQEVLNLIKDKRDPLVALAEIVDTSTVPEHRMTASSILAPYPHSKRGTIPAPRYVEDAITVPEFVSIQEAQNFLADIARRSGSGELELQSATDISNLVKNWILSVTAQDELQLKISKENPQGPQEIHITGGLPSLPGTDVIMSQEPTLNGHVNGHGPVIDHVDSAACALAGTRRRCSDGFRAVVTRGSQRTRVRFGQRPVLPRMPQKRALVRSGRAARVTAPTATKR